ncbi:MAG: hypothetical protein IJ469_03815 [Candidatus Methanomethylophilaceae archaeon]|nr:hypothetical protein [Candidatus Methanomethylophilaceae archaeon]
MDEFSVTFTNEVNIRRRSLPQEVDSKLQTVIDFLVARGSGTYAQMSEATGLSIHQIQRLVHDLVDDGTIAKSKIRREVVLTLRSR